MAPDSSQETAAKIGVIRVHQASHNFLGAAKISVHPLALIQPYTVGKVQRNRQTRRHTNRDLDIHRETIKRTKSLCASEALTNFPLVRARTCGLVLASTQSHLVTQDAMLSQR